MNEDLLGSGDMRRAVRHSYDPITTFNEDICSLLCKSLARGWVQDGEE